jgi:dihydrofolate synthase/folylpolyglutamate synthase
LASTTKAISAIRSSKSPAEKAGIAKRNVPLVTQSYEPEIVSRIAEVPQALAPCSFRAAQAGQSRLTLASFTIATRRGELALPLPRLPGDHQISTPGWQLPYCATSRCLPSAFRACRGDDPHSWPARLQRLEFGPLVNMLPDGSECWVDGGHNPAAARLIADFATITGAAAHR